MTISGKTVQFLLSLAAATVAVAVARHATILADLEDSGIALAAACLVLAVLFLAQKTRREAGLWDPLRSGLAGWIALLWAAYLAGVGLRLAPWVSDLVFAIAALVLWLGRDRAVFLVLALGMVAGLAVRSTANEYAILGLSVVWSVALPLALVHRVDQWLHCRASRPLRELPGAVRLAAIGAAAAAIGVYVVGPTFLMTDPDQRRARLLALAPKIQPDRPLSPLAQRLKGHVTALALEIGERNAFQPKEQRRAVDYVLAQLKAMGYAPRRLEYKVRGMPGVEDGTVYANVEAILPAAPAAPGAWVIGAHYDSAPGTPGADDNATGVAAMLEVARALKGRRPGREIRFVAFGTEEPPAFGTSNMGSYRYALGLKENGVAVHGMFSLEMLGYFNDRRGSQLYPPFLHLINPAQADFVGAVSNTANRSLLKRFQRDWEAGSRFPLTGSVLPGPLADLALSDQLNFWSLGLPALLLSDTAFYRNPNYHQDSDLPGTLDYERMAQVTEGLITVLSSGPY